MADLEDTTTLGKSPAFQFYPKDFLTDENVRVMSLQERGAYITLLCLCWLEGTLPRDTDRMARLCGVPLAAFRRLWPALEACFRVSADREDRLVHPRLERIRSEQSEFRRRQSDNGRLGGRPKKPEESHSKGLGFSGLTQTEPKKSSPSPSPSPSPISDLLSPDSGTRPEPAEARSKRPVFRCQRFVVHEWMLDDLRRMLGTHFDDFDMHEWFYTLSSRADQQNIIVPQRDGGKWLQEQTLAEAVRRGLPVATTQPATGKTAGNAAAIARFIARGNQ